MDEDGPKPMKNLKPTQKNLNGSDQFRVAHQSEYDNRSKTSEDRIERVHEHNMAHPKLRDEQDRRRSMTQVTCYEKKMSRYDPQCKACAKLRQLAKLRKLNVKPRCTSRTTKKKYHLKYHRSKSRVKKKPKYGKGPLKHRRKRSMNKLWKYVEVSDKNTEMDCGICPLSTSLANARKDVIDLNENNNNDEKSRHKANRKSNSVNTLNNPESSNISMSSYNTFPYMDEPMVDNTDECCHRQ